MVSVYYMSYSVGIFRVKDDIDELSGLVSILTLFGSGGEDDENPEQLLSVCSEIKEKSVTAHKLVRTNNYVYNYRTIKHSYRRQSFLIHSLVRYQKGLKKRMALL